MPAAHGTARRRIFVGAACLLLLAMAFALHGRALDGFWRIDDPFLLIKALDHRVWSYFLSPRDWRDVSNAFLTPWVQVVFELNLAVFGLDPAWHYARALIAAGAAAAALCLALTLWLPPAWAAFGGLLLLAGSPVAMLVEQLNASHYLDGLVFACIAVWLYGTAVRARRHALSVMAALAYALAMTCKESYVPLVGMLLFLPEGDWRARLRQAVPVLLVALLYIPWRIWMLGTAWGGYTGGAELLSPWPVVRGATAFIVGAGITGGAAAGIAAAVGAAAAWRGGLRGLVFAAVTAVCLLVPLLPVIENLAVQAWPLATGRYLLPAWAVASAFIAIGLHALYRGQPWRHLMTAPTAVLLLLAVTVQGRHAAATVAPWLERADALGRFAWDTPRPARLWLDLDGLEHAVESTIKLRQRVQAQVPNLELLSDEILLVDHAASGKAVHGYDRDCLCVRDISERLEEKLATWSTRRREMALSVRMHTDGEVLSWQLGPWEEGNYTAIMADGAGRVPVPRTGEVRLHDHDIDLYVRYDSPEGWVTYSPRLQLDPQSEPDVDWSRAAPSSATGND